MLQINRRGRGLESLRDALEIGPSTFPARRDYASLRIPSLGMTWGMGGIFVAEFLVLGYYFVGKGFFYG